MMSVLRPYRKQNDLFITQYVPSGAVEEMISMLETTEVIVRLSAPRKRVHGTYCRPVKGYSHRISINNDLNPYAFLITLLHEFAHLYAFEQDKSLRHDAAWKKHFSVLLHRFIALNVFPEDIENALLHHLQRIRSSDFMDIQLTCVLQSYDSIQEENNEIVLMDLPEKTKFMYNNKMFTKQERLRKYYVCIEIKTKRKYRFHPLAKVTAVSA